MKSPLLANQNVQRRARVSHLTANPRSQQTMAPASGRRAKSQPEMRGGASGARRVTPQQVGGTAQSITAAFSLFDWALFFLVSIYMTTRAVVIFFIGWLTGSGGGQPDLYTQWELGEEAILPSAMAVPREPHFDTDPVLDVPITAPPVALHPLATAALVATRNEVEWRKISALQEEERQLDPEELVDQAAALRALHMDTASQPDLA
jgi:hypothetical protein